MTLRAFALAAISALSLAASVGIAHADRLEDIRSNGTVRIAIGNEPPFTAIGGDGKVSGAAPDVALATKLGELRTQYPGTELKQVQCAK